MNHITPLRTTAQAVAHPAVPDPSITAPAIRTGHAAVLRTLLDCHETTRALGVSKSKLYELAKDEPLLRPVRVGGRSVRWVSDRVEAYVARLVEEADQQQGALA